jgi:predicted nuclease of predicted toxin-antitoxin system
MDECSCNNRILIADDNDFNILLLKQLFQKIKIKQVSLMKAKNIEQKDIEMLV